MSPSRTTDQVMYKHLYYLYFFPQFVNRRSVTAPTTTPRGPLLRSGVGGPCYGLSVTGMTFSSFPAPRHPVEVPPLQTTHVRSATAERTQGPRVSQTPYTTARQSLVPPPTLGDYTKTSVQSHRMCPVDSHETQSPPSPSPRSKTNGGRWGTLPSSTTDPTDPQWTGGSTDPGLR